MDIIKEIWKELQHLGFTGSIKTLPELFSWLRKVKLIHSEPILKKKNESYSTSLVKLSEFSEPVVGKFGVLFLVLRETIGTGSDGTIVFLKSTPNHPRSLLLEGIIQSIAYTTLTLYGFPKAIPRVLDILKHPDYGTVITIERNPGAKLFADYLRHEFHWNQTIEENDKMILDIIAQVATYLAVLEYNLGLNHRDLKGTNVLMIETAQKWSQTCTVDAYNWTVSCNSRAILIDFGFACVGKIEGGQSVASAGEFLPTIDFCPKKGRDLFLLFASLWDVKPFRDALTKKTQALFYKWLQDTSLTNWAEWLITSTQSNLKSMYLLTNADHFKSEACSPMNVLMDISKTYPEIVQLQKIRRASTPLPV
jgi:serine/threonine protein kinase